MKSAEHKEPVYRLEGICKTYLPVVGRGKRESASGNGGVEALKGVSLSVFPGEFLGILGRSGEGKSTLLSLLGALEAPTSGALLYQGLPLHEHGLVRFRRQEVGFVFQMFHLLPYMSALDNVTLGLTMAGVQVGQARTRALRWLETLGLGQRCHHLPDALSGGEKQRVAIARAMVKEPKVLLADEPTGNLDKDSRVEVLQAIQKMNAQYRTTVILVTHNEADAIRYADRILVMDGRTIARELLVEEREGKRIAKEQRRVPTAPVPA